MRKGELQGEPGNGCSLGFFLSKEQLARSREKAWLWGVRRPGFESRLCPNGLTGWEETVLYTVRHHTKSRDGKTLGVPGRAFWDGS